MAFIGMDLEALFPDRVDYESIFGGHNYDFYIDPYLDYFGDPYVEGKVPWGDCHFLLLWKNGKGQQMITRYRK